MFVLRFFFIILEVILIFNLMIIVHEFGHFLAARWRGLVVEKFGIWFGKPIWKKTINGVEFSLGSIPAGGFVALPQMAPMEVMEGKVDTPREMLPPISALDKIIVAFAGPLFSVLLATFFAFVVFWAGRPVGEPESTQIVGYVDEDKPAAKAVIVNPAQPGSPVQNGFQLGDKILRVDGHPVTRFVGPTDSVAWDVIRSEGDTILFDIERNGQPLQLVSGFDKEKRAVWERAGFRNVGVGPAVTPVIGKITKGSTAEKAGLKVDDAIVAINGVPLYSYDGIDTYLESHSERTVTFSVERGPLDKREKSFVKLSLDGPLIDEVVKNGPADVAGIKKGDQVLRVNDTAIFGASTVANMVSKKEGEIFSMTYKRDGVEKTVKMRAAKPQDYDKAVVGIIWGEDRMGGISWNGMGIVKIAHLSPLEQLKIAGKTLFSTLAAVTSRKSDVGIQQLSGPVGIMSTYYRILSSDYGWQMALWFSVVLNVNLAIMNMLPIPVLDGGHITLALVEAARRKPVNTQILIWVQTACAYVIMGFLLFVTFFDSGDLLGFGKKSGVRFDRPVPAVTE